jgi:hypothetical protein|tara:strand:- start:96 stop:278 length:183 start_codon:yes stop_codon:yes gene_type:complete
VEKIESYLGQIITFGYEKLYKELRISVMVLLDLSPKEGKFEIEFLGIGIEEIPALKHIAN